MVRVVFGLALVAVVLTAGCRKQPPQPVDIKGKAEKADGKPLAGVLLRFHAQEAASNQAALSCATQADGSFSTRGVPGNYKVTVGAIPTRVGGSPATGSVEGTGKTSLPDVPAIYQSLTETPWDVTVDEGGKTDIVLKLK
jgi:hypothetical protein